MTAAPSLVRDETTRVEDPVHLLLVDDRPENLLALEAILEPLGHTLLRASSGDDALRTLLRYEVAVILLDVQMPGMNGFDTAMLIKSRERTRHIPIIFLTAISKDEPFVFRGYEVGAVDYMSKPFQPDILRSKVTVLVDLHLKQRQLVRQEAELRESQRRELELQHRAEMNEAQARMAEIVTSAMDAIVTFNEEGEITLFNAAAERMFLRSAKDTLGECVTVLFPEGIHETLLADIKANAARDAQSYAVESAPQRVTALNGRRATDEEFPLEISISKLPIGGDNTYTLIARDITERAEHERTLREQAHTLEQALRELEGANLELQSRSEELERAISARSRFYASMSHELRTPINAIIGYNTLLLDNIYGALNDKQVQGISRTHKAAKHLLELVNDVLDLSKIEAGKVELALQPVAFPALIEDLFVTVQPLADELQCELSLLREGDSRTVITDPRRVRQILLNLLSNAIKFGRGKPIDVTCTALDDGGVLIEVRDHGPGILPEDLPRIFDEFVQLEGTHQLGGTGLGLPISKRLAGLLNASLTAESEHGDGSTFRLRLPKSCETNLKDRLVATPLVPRADAKPAARKSAEHALPAADEEVDLPA